jgi:squalene-associated FAD-dependent desaturase
VSTVVIVGAGLAGLAAAQALSGRGFRVIVLEARNRLGGRAGSFTDPETGRQLDACQHVSMGCCTNLAHFLRTAGASHFLAPQRSLYFMTPDRRVSPLTADSLPAPLHLARSGLLAHYLTLGEKLRVARGLAAMQWADPGDDPPLLEWLLRRGQTRRTVDRFWGLVAVSALNEVPERLGLKYARKVFVEALLGHPRGFQVEVPTVPLGRLYGSMSMPGVEVVYESAARRFLFAEGRVSGVELRDGRLVQADWYVSAVPFDRISALLPSEVMSHPTFAAIRGLDPSPITSVHLWYDRPVLTLPHVVLVDCLGQWAFDRGATPEGHYLQVVISASRGLGHDEALPRVVAEIESLFPGERALLRSRVVTERAATFSAVPGVDRLRPGQGAPIPNLLLAGDWTATGWPATMEGAVRSGYLAAEALLARAGRPARILVPDLG